jgi:hypothetical protein
MTRPRSFRTAVMPLIVLAALSASSPAGATPPTIPTFTATVSDLNMVTLSWVTIGGYDSNPYRLVYIHGPRIYPVEAGNFRRSMTSASRRRAPLARHARSRSA